jgi:Neuraminidase (sialidase)
MKKHRLFKKAFTFAIWAFGICLYAQQVIILDPSTMVPADTGYYIGGVNKDKNGDGVDEFYNGCVDEYGDSDHRENGKQQGFTYNKSMIMPDCWPKDAIDDHSKAKIDHAEGYIQLTKSKYPGTDSASLGYIICPAVEELVNLSLEVSPDATRTNERPIDWWIEYSKDNGATWENTYLQDGLPVSDKKYGEEHFYDGSTFLEFEEMKTASKTSPIVLRIMSRPQTEAYTAQRLKVHYIEINAKSVSVRNVIADTEKIRVSNNVISVEDGSIEVFNLLGQFMGSGMSVSVKSGVYIVRFESGKTQKILVH